VMTFLWWFDLSFSFFNLQVIWAIGLCMIALSLLIYLPRKLLLILGLVLVFGHNLLDGITMEGTSFGAIIWYILHQSAFIQMGDTWFSFLYPVMPWVGVMSLGYIFGTIYTKDYPVQLRRIWLLRLGLGCIGLFLVVRGINVYGDMVPWAVQKNTTYTILSFFNVSKYPPSLLFLLITLGPAFLFLYAIENIKNKLTDFLTVYGRVPLFYYIIHVLVIHVVAVLGIAISGGDWTLMILTMDSFMNGSLAGYGYSLGVTYLIWMGIVVSLYPVCLRYMKYKASNRDKKWLSRPELQHGVKKSGRLD